MKLKNIFIGAVLLLGISVSSCTDAWKFGDSFLEKAPGGDITKDTVFNNAEYTRQFLWSCYSKLHYGIPYCWTGGEAQGMNTGVIGALSDCMHSHCDWDEVTRQYTQELTLPHLRVVMIMVVFLILIIVFGRLFAHAIYFLKM